jgi:type I site-specific restriction-modification system R (restriction) subunit
VAGSKCSGTFPKDVKTKADALYKKAFDRVFTKGNYVDTIGPDYNEKIREALIACIREDMLQRPREMKDAVVNIISKSENADYLKPILEEMIAEEEKRRRAREVREAVEQATKKAEAVEQATKKAEAVEQATKKAEAAHHRLAEEIARTASQKARAEKEKLAKAELHRREMEHTSRGLAMLPRLDPISERVNNLTKSMVDGDIMKLFGLKT